MLVVLTINLKLVSPGYIVQTLNTSTPGDVTVPVITGDEGIPTEREREKESRWDMKGD